MKLIIQLPCYNEEQTLGEALRELPRAVEGFESVEWMVVDDGSTDATVDVAREHGVDHIVSHPHNLGLARAFMTGLEACLAKGADVIVNTDADNQYHAGDIPKLTKPIVMGEADMVVGARPIDYISDFSKTKKLLQKVGSGIVRFASGTSVQDAPSGFRAFSKQTAMQIHVFDPYTYTLETLIQTGRRGMLIQSVPVRVNAQTRPSRLVRSSANYVWRSAQTIVRIFVIYSPLRVFCALALMSFLCGFLLGLRFLYFYLTGEGEGNVQSVILAAFLMSSGIIFAAIGLIADLIAVNRKLLEKLNYRLQRLENEIPQQKPS